jgi:ABC-type spermidine/putrescine transport system permease subunit I
VNATPANARFLGATLVAPGLGILTLFLFVPLALIVGLSVLTYSPTKIWLPVLTAVNYEKFFHPYYLGVMWTTIEIGLLTTAACAVLGFPVAYFLARAPARWLGVWLFLLVTPLMVSSVIRIFGWLVLLGRRGLVNATLEAAGFRGIDLLHNVPAVVIGLTELLLPFMVLPLMAAIETIPRSVEEAARNLGASSLQLFWRVLLPLSLPGLVSGSLLVYTVAISALVTPALMGGRKVRMLGNLVYDEVLTSMNWPFASSIAVILLIVTAAVMLGYLRTMRGLARRSGQA